jgi:hypothetical protein
MFAASPLDRFFTLSWVVSSGTPNAFGALLRRVATNFFWLSEAGSLRHLAVLSSLLYIISFSARFRSSDKLTQEQTALAQLSSLHKYLPLSERPQGSERSRFFGFSGRAKSLGLWQSQGQKQEAYSGPQSLVFHLWCLLRYSSASQSQRGLPLP